MKQLLLIVNPAAGTRQAAHALPEIISAFMAAGYESTVYVTGARGDAVRFAAGRGGDFDRIVCAGGDGTFNEVLAGLLSAGHKTPIGYIPAGSTNDFAASIGLSQDLMQAARDAVGDRLLAFDAGRFRDRYFSYVASFGAFTRASYATPQSVKNALGHLAYLLEGMIDLATIRPVWMRIETDDGVFEGEFLFGAVSNSTSLGGILTLPEADVDMNDGVFEIMLIRNPKNALELQTILTALTTRQYACSMIGFSRTAHVTAEAQEDVAWSLDGEYADGGRRVEIDNIHDAIRVAVGNGRKQL